MSRIIVLITSSFPYEKGEAFLEEEMKYVRCDKLIILPLSGKGVQRELKTTVPYTVHPLSIHSRPKLCLSLLGQLFSKKIFQELRSLHRAGKLSFASAIESLSFLSHGDLYKKEAVGVLSKLLTPGDSVCFYGYWLLLQAYIAVELKKHFGGTAVSRCHGGDVYAERNPLGVLPMRKYLMEHLDFIYPISEHGKKYLESEYSYLNKKIIVNRLGAESGVQSAHSRESAFSIVSCSWISELKRVDRIISVLSLLRNVRWTHYGGGDMTDEIVKFAHEKLDGKIEWQITGAIEHHEILKQYASHDYHLFINLSNSEGVPVSIMEACAYGIPIIATDVGGSSEVVIDGYNGFLVGKDFTDTTVASIIMSLQQMSDSKYKKICANSLQRWQDEYSAENNFSKFYDNLPF